MDRLGAGDGRLAIFGSGPRRQALAEQQPSLNTRNSARPDGRRLLKPLLHPGRH